ALPSFRLAARAEAAIEPALAQTDLVLDRDYAVIDLRTTVYPDSDEPVWVDLGGGRVADIRERSEILALLGNREERESLLVVLDPEKAAHAQAAAAAIGALEPD